jgi:HEAT repeat protein
MPFTKLSCAVLALPVVLAVADGCGPKRTANEAAQDLRAPVAEVRLKAARDIEANAREQRGLPPEIVESLLQAFQNETDAKTKGSMITALGYTGDPRVKPMLEAYLQTSDPDQQRWAARAYKKYVVKAGQFPEDHEFPEYWPYGTPGFPAPAEE